MENERQVIREVEKLKNTIARKSEENGFLHKEIKVRKDKIKIPLIRFIVKGKE